MNKVVVIGTSTLGCSILLALAMMQAGDVIMVDPIHGKEQPVYGVLPEPTTVRFSLSEHYVPELATCCLDYYEPGEKQRQYGQYKNRFTQVNGNRRREIMRTRNNC